MKPTMGQIAQENFESIFPFIHSPVKITILAKSYGKPKNVNVMQMDLVKKVDECE
jgi:hypothetical protein